MRITGILVIGVLLAACESTGKREEMANENAAVAQSMSGVADCAGPPPHVMIRMADDQCPRNVRDIAPGAVPADRCELAGVRQSDAVCRHNSERIIWRRTGNGPFSIQFEDVPPWFDTCKYDDASNRYCCTVVNDTPGSVYRYSVTVGDCVLDPRIIIN